jgi:hypothetical protein
VSVATVNPQYTRNGTYLAEIVINFNNSILIRCARKKSPYCARPIPSGSEKRPLKNRDAPAKTWAPIRSCKPQDGINSIIFGIFSDRAPFTPKGQSRRAPCGSRVST